MLKNTKNTRGFTIAEMIIVLSVAGLIFGIVFLAIPQLQRSSRDTKRRAIVARLASELDAYTQEHEGTYPFKGRTIECRSEDDGPIVEGAANWQNPCKVCDPEDLTPPRERKYKGPDNCQDWYDDYVKGKTDITDPETDEILIIKMAYEDDQPAWPRKPDKRTVWISAGNKCDGSSLTTGEGGEANATNYAVLIALDQEGQFYCLDSQQLRG